MAKKRVASAKSKPGVSKKEKGSITIRFYEEGFSSESTGKVKLHEAIHALEKTKFDLLMKKQ